MNVTAIPDREAASLLGVTYETIRNAVKRGDLIRVPKAGLVQHVAKEQVELFKGKKQVRLASLNREELKAWEDLEATIKGTPASVAPVASSPSLAVNMDANQFVRALIDNGVVSTGNQLTFQSALADKEDSNDEEEVEQGGYSLAFLVAILLGLVILLYLATKTEVKTRVERTIEQIGLEKEDLITSQREAIATLRSHPREVATLKDIIVSENIDIPGLQAVA